MKGGGCRLLFYTVCVLHDTKSQHFSLAHEHKLTYITYSYLYLLTCWRPSCTQWPKRPTESPWVAPTVHMIADPTMLLCMCHANEASKKSNRREGEGKCHVVPSGYVVY